MIARCMTILGFAALISCGVAATGASVIGTNPPVQSLTRARVQQLPVGARAAWLAYLARSERQRQEDKDAFAAELNRAAITTPTEPTHGYAARSIPLDRDPSWYGSEEARRIADIVVSFQTPAGGWGKNLDMSEEPRHPGKRYGPDNLSRFPSPDDFDTPREPDWNYIGTIDNDATTTQLNFLAKVIAAEEATNPSEPLMERITW